MADLTLASPLGLVRMPLDQSAKLRSRTKSLSLVYKEEFFLANWSLKNWSSAAPAGRARNAMMIATADAAGVRASGARGVGVRDIRFSPFVCGWTCEAGLQSCRRRGRTSSKNRKR